MQRKTPFSTVKVYLTMIMEMVFQTSLLSVEKSTEDKLDL